MAVENLLLLVLIESKLSHERGLADSEELCPTELYVSPPALPTHE
jgi:hypothetical protein